jgi:adenosylhomocysteinase
VLANGGSSDVEIDVATLSQIASARRAFRPDVEEISMRDGRRIYLLAGGKSLHGSTANVPSSVLDLSFANQALSAEYLLKNRDSLRAEVYRVPVEIDRQVARLKLEAMGAKVDRLTVEQEQYLAELAED